MKCETPKANKKRTRNEASILLTAFAHQVHQNKSALLGPAVAARILRCRPANISGAYAFKWDYLEREILSKYAGGEAKSEKERRNAAIEKLLASNLRCREFNRSYLQPDCNSDQRLINARARQIVAAVLAELHDFLEDFNADCKFSGGASVGNDYEHRDPYYKYGNPAPCCTARMVPFATKLIFMTPLWDICKIKTVVGNHVFTVPKNATVDRAACKEPELNQIFQTAVGNHIRRRLKVFGIDLNDQTRNQRLAYRGSIDGSLATLDLKDASNSMSLRSVFELVPRDWYEWLTLLRSPCGRVSDKTVTWSLFSTMGNGFTFELESLLFFAISKAASERALNSTRRVPLVSVFGDDIIVETPCAKAVISSLEHFGFILNLDKSYTTGPFRESCGAHYYQGYDVKPIYVRRDCDHPARVIWLLNALRRWGTEHGVFDPAVESLWITLRREFCPSEFLGGDDLYGADMVYSHDRNRARLLSRMPSKRIDGPAALLRWFQLSDVPTLFGKAPIRSSTGNERITTGDEEDMLYTVELYSDYASTTGQW